jgi:hypothetical protein
VLDTGAQQVADTVERVALAAAVPVDLLLYPAPDLVQRLGRESDDVKGVQHRDGILELVIERVLIPVKRVQGRHLDRGPEGLAPFGQPAGVDAAGPTRDEVEQPGPDPSGLVGG